MTPSIVVVDQYGNLADSFVQAGWCMSGQVSVTRKRDGTVALIVTLEPGAAMQPLPAMLEYAVERTT